jgi:hypothetical protein
MSTRKTERVKVKCLESNKNIFHDSRKGLLFRLKFEYQILGQRDLIIAVDVTSMCLNFKSFFFGFK